MITKHLIIGLLLFVLAGYVPVAGAVQADSFTRTAAKFVRVELFFGFDRKNQPPVQEAEWLKFLDEEVTPRFPDGFTVLSALGQYRIADGSIVRENSRVLIVLFPKSAKKKSATLIEEIRAAYKQRFQQESVMRLEFIKSVAVEF